MSNILKALEAILANGPIGMTPESRATMLEHFRSCEEDAAKFRSRTVELSINIDRTPLDEMLADFEGMKDRLSDHMMRLAVQRGLVLPPVGSDWVSLKDKDRPYHLEPVFVTDGNIIGISKYNEAYERMGRSPFQTTYEVCEWDQLGDITHFRRMTALALPDGSRMQEPELKALRVGATCCPNCKEPLHWKQIHGMRLKEEVRVRGVRHMIHNALCPKCNVDYLVKAAK